MQAASQLAKAVRRLTMEKEMQELTAKYKEDVRNIEQELSDLTKQKRLLDEKKSQVFEYKKRVTKFFNESIDSLRKYNAASQIQKYENISGETKHKLNRLEQGIEAEQHDIEKRRKKALLSKEETDHHYRQTLRAKRG